MVVLKWVGIVIALAALTILGFVLAAWLSPGNPLRSYLIFGLALLIVTLSWRLLAGAK